ncbi:hypothetical protein HII17_09485 [Thalassotalea sp. M1531]|uniref:Class IIb bacteriocin, lactobin A/cerein 7B family n=1 Tax=Thalassotalea algicola TaxID=2716224 RepID=A0A7Y0LEN9_9GAMM|nr:hypothetical protein [Thalassotalea algicola]NMP31795.1 hypothetical protein [Thalassotalea algicola]
MRELSVNEIKEVSGGINPAVVIVAVKVAQKLAPVVKAAATAAASYIAGSVGYELGNG